MVTGFFLEKITLNEKCHQPQSWAAGVDGREDLGATPSGLERIGTIEAELSTLERLWVLYPQLQSDKYTFPSPETLDGELLEKRD
ncbi:unnamed protein product [Heligmosomoides polygyrus]|uniref:Oligoendopeptidase F n=1 Tax=Heligmosomoides polygyrus TaxID=6339 RepID=A0A183FEV4_HELPZ|nr:unnamed protein product [Heligmosomoides polygyrus]